MDTTTPPPADAKRNKQRSQDLWSHAIIERGYSVVPIILLWGQARLGLTPDEMNVLLQIISHRWFAGSDPHPSKETIAERMGKHPRTVQAYLTSLERKGFLRRVQRYKPHKGQDTNGYDLSGLIQKLNAIAPEFKKVADQNKLRRKRAEAPAP
jgi:DNA-binding CsgD family transcriptional regulator